MTRIFCKLIEVEEAAVPARVDCYGDSLPKAAPMGWKQNFKGTTDRAILQNYSDKFIIFFKADGVVFIPSNYNLQKQ